MPEDEQQTSVRVEITQIKEQLKQPLPTRHQRLIPLLIITASILAVVVAWMLIYPPRAHDPIRANMVDDISATLIIPYPASAQANPSTAAPQATSPTSDQIELSLVDLPSDPKWVHHLPSIYNQGSAVLISQGGGKLMLANRDAVTIYEVGSGKFITGYDLDKVGIYNTLISAVISADGNYAYFKTTRRADQPVPPSPTPDLVLGRYQLPLAADYLTALDLNTGEIVWQHYMKGLFTFQEFPVQGVIVALVNADKDSVIETVRSSDGLTIAQSKISGNIGWEIKTSDGVLYFSTGWNIDGNKLVAVRAATGELLWSKSIPALHQIVLDDQWVYVVGTDQVMTFSKGDGSAGPVLNNIGQSYLIQTGNNIFLVATDSAANKQYIRRIKADQQTVSASEAKGFDPNAPVAPFSASADISGLIFQHTVEHLSVGKYQSRIVAVSGTDGNVAWRSVPLPSSGIEAANNSDPYLFGGMVYVVIEGNFYAFGK